MFCEFFVTFVHMSARQSKLNLSIHCVCVRPYATYIDDWPHDFMQFVCGCVDDYMVGLGVCGGGYGVGEFWDYC